MDLRRAFFSRSMKLLRHHVVARWLAGPRAMDTFVGVVRTLGRTRARVQSRTADVRCLVRDLWR